MAAEPFPCLLWEAPPFYRSNAVERPYLEAFLLDRPAPAVIVCPGGRYRFLSLGNEGRTIAEAFRALGFHAFLLHYRVFPNRYPVPQLDLARAIRLVRSRADEWQVQGPFVAACGFSAGGHLCASVAGLHDSLTVGADELSAYSARPDALVLGYAVISFGECTHLPSVEALLGEAASPAERERLSCERLVTRGYPPSFIWTCQNDSKVPVRNSELLAEACQQQGVRHELRIYPGGEHGVGLGAGQAVVCWSGEAAAFLRRCFGE